MRSILSHLGIYYNLSSPLHQTEVYPISSSPSSILSLSAIQNLGFQHVEFPPGWCCMDALSGHPVDAANVAGCVMYSKGWGLDADLPVYFQKVTRIMGGIQLMMKKGVDESSNWGTSILCKIADMQFNGSPSNNPTSETIGPNKYWQINSSCSLGFSFNQSPFHIMFLQVFFLDKMYFRSLTIQFGQIDVIQVSVQGF